MADMLAIISKAVFEADSKSAKPGDVLPIDRYNSTNKNLLPLEAGGTLFLVTVRPPDEKLWLVAALEQPKHNGSAWVAAANVLPVTDISGVRDQLKFSTGTGIQAKKGALGMSLQTPRQLTADDVAVLRGAAGGGAPAAAAVPAPPPEPKKPLTVKDLLLAAIFEVPHDDERRLVYADYLLEKGDPRGEFISRSVALFSGGLDPLRRKQFNARVDELVATHGGEWFGAVKEIADDFTVRRGFVEEIRGEASTLLPKLNAVFQAEPVRKLHLSEVKDVALKALATAPWLKRIEYLALSGSPTAKGLKELLSADGISNLKGLNLGGCELDESAVQAIAKAKCVRSLERLALTGNPIGDEGISALAEASLVSLKNLYLAATEITDEGLENLSGSPHLKALKFLGLERNEEVSSDGVESLRSSLPSLEKVEFDEY